MNRTIRRQLARAKTKPIPSRSVPRHIDEWEQFEQIEMMALKLGNGAIEYEGPHPVMVSSKGEAYRVIPALNGWITYWRTLADKHAGQFGTAPYDDEPMRLVSRRLENSVPLTPEHVEGFKRVVAAQRALFRAIPRDVVSSEARTVQIKLLIEDRV